MSDFKCKYDECDTKKTTECYQTEYGLYRFLIFILS